MDAEHQNMLERLRQNQRQDYLKGQVYGSVQATDRLMKELRDIYRSETFKKSKATNKIHQFVLQFYLVNVTLV